MLAINPNGFANVVINDAFVLDVDVDVVEVAIYRDDANHGHFYHERATSYVKEVMGTNKCSRHT